MQYIALDKSELALTTNGLLTATFVISLAPESI
jgi:hypothetical protein